MLLSCKKRAKRNQTKSEGRGKRQKSVKDASEGRRKTRKIHSSLESYPPMEPLACVIITLETSFWKSENERHSGPLQRKHLIFGYPCASRIFVAAIVWRVVLCEREPCAKPTKTDCLRVTLFSGRHSRLATCPTRSSSCKFITHQYAMMIVSSLRFKQITKWLDKILRCLVSFSPKPPKFRRVARELIPNGCGSRSRFGKE